jgi:hypothetical protein
MNTPEQAEKRVSHNRRYTDLNPLKHHEAKIEYTTDSYTISLLIAIVFIIIGISFADLVLSILTWRYKC